MIPRGIITHSKVSALNSEMKTEAIHLFPQVPRCLKCWTWTLDGAAHRNFPALSHVWPPIGTCGDSVCFVEYSDFKSKVTDIGGTCKKCFVFKLSPMNSFHLEISKDNFTPLIPIFFNDSRQESLACIMLDSATFYGSALGPGCSSYGSKKFNVNFTADTSDDEPNDSVPSEAQALLRGTFHNTDYDSNSDDNTTKIFFEVQEVTRRLSPMIRSLPALHKTCESTTREVRNKKNIKKFLRMHARFCGKRD